MIFGSIVVLYEVFDKVSIFTLLNPPSETPTNLPPAELSAVRDNEEAEEGAKSVTGTTLGLVVVIVILVCVLIVVLIGSVVRFRRSRNSVPVQPPVSIEMN